MTTIKLKISRKHYTFWCDIQTQFEEKVINNSLGFSHLAKNHFHITYNYTIMIQRKLVRTLGLLTSDLLAFFLRQIVLNARGFFVRYLDTCGCAASFLRGRPMILRIDQLIGWQILISPCKTIPNVHKSLFLRVIGTLFALEPYKIDWFLARRQKGQTVNICNKCFARCNYISLILFIIGDIFLTIDN